MNSNKLNSSELKPRDLKRLNRPERWESACEYLKLENGMEVFLISNKKLSTTNVNLVVKTGSAFEGFEIDGLAHLLEHALFLGTKRYPGANQFGKYVRTHGGSTNAVTDTTMTSFSVNIPSTFTEQTLDMFSEFFKSPLFKEDLLLNEIGVINNEFLSKTNSYYILLEHVLKEISDEAHLYHKFYYGNSDSLLKRPLKNGINVRSKLINFYENYYVSNNMILVLISNLDIERLIELTEKYFSSIRSNFGTNYTLKTDFKGLSLTLEYPFLGVKNKFIKINMNSDRNELMLVFPIPNKYSFVTVRTFARYLSFFLSSNSPSNITGEIISSKKICKTISVSDFQSQLGFSQIVVSLLLTENGTRKIDEVIIYFHLCINTIKNTIFIDEFYAEIKRDNHSKYSDFEKNIALIQIFDIVKAYIYSDSAPVDFLYSNYNTDGFTAEVFGELIEHFNMDKMFIIAVGNCFDIKCLLEKNTIKVTDSHIYHPKISHRIQKFRTILGRNRLESKYIIKERYFLTKYSVWDISSHIFESTKSMNVINGIDFSNMNLPVQALSQMNSCNSFGRSDSGFVMIKPPLLFDVAFEFEKMRNKKGTLFKISEDLKITSIWKGLFYLYVPSKIISESMLLLRLFLPPMYGKKSSKIYQLRDLCIKNTRHSYALINVLTEFVKYKVCLSNSHRKRCTDFRIYPTFNSFFPNYTIGIELFLHGELRELSTFLLEFSNSLKLVSSISESEFNGIMNLIISSQCSFFRKNTQRDLINNTEMRILSNGVLETNESYIKLMRSIKYTEIITLAEFMRSSCLFEGIFVGEMAVNILKSSLDTFICNLRGKSEKLILDDTKALMYVKDDPRSENYSKDYYKKLFFKQNENSTPFTKCPTSQNHFDLVDLFSIPPNKNRLFFLEKKFRCKHNIIKLSIFFKKEDPTTMVRLYILNQIFFDHFFELMRQRRQIAYEFNSEINNIHDRLLTYSFIVQTDSSNIIQTTNTLLECVSELSPEIISSDLLKVAIEERIEMLSQNRDPNLIVNEYIKLTNNKSFNYNWTKDLIMELKSLTFYQFQRWFSNSIKSPPILVTAIMSEATSIRERKRIERYIPDRFVRLRNPKAVFKFEKLKTFKFYHQIFN